MDTPWRDALWSDDLVVRPREQNPAHGTQDWPTELHARLSVAVADIPEVTLTLSSPTPVESRGGTSMWALYYTSPQDASPSVIVEASITAVLDPEFWDYEWAPL